MPLHPDYDTMIVRHPADDMPECQHCGAQLHLRLIDGKKVCEDCVAGHYPGVDWDDLERLD